MFIRYVYVWMMLNGSVVSGVGLIAGLLDVGSRSVGGCADSASSSHVSSSHSAASSDVSSGVRGVGDGLVGSSVGGLVGGRVGSSSVLLGGVSGGDGVGGSANVLTPSGSVLSASGGILCSSGVDGGVVGGGDIDSASS